MPINDIAKKELDKIIAEIPSGKKGMLNTSISNEGFRAEVSWYVRPNWSLSAYAEKGWTTQTKTGVAFKGTW